MAFLNDTPNEIGRFEVDEFDGGDEGVPSGRKSSENGKGEVDVAEGSSKSDKLAC